MLCSLKLSSSIADWSFDSRSFFRELSPSSSSLMPREEALSPSCSLTGRSLSLLFPLMLEMVLFGEETPASSSTSAAVGGILFTSIPFRNDLVSTLNASAMFRSACNSSVQNLFSDLTIRAQLIDHSRCNRMVYQNNRSVKNDSRSIHLTVNYKIALLILYISKRDNCMHVNT